jgi:outer membrane PBP1 activator LpoA protein
LAFSVTQGILMRLFRALGPIIVSTALLAMAGCATVSAPTPQELAQAQQADALYQQGRLDQAAQAYMALAAQHRGASDYFRLRAAETWREEGTLNRAAQALADIDRDRLQPADALQYDLLQAEIALKHDDAAGALKWNSRPADQLPANLQLRALELRARAQALGGDAWGAALTRMSMDARLSGLDQAQNRQEVLKLLTGMGAAALQQHVAALAPDDPMYRWAGEALNQLGVVVARQAPTLDHPVGTVLPGADAREGYRMPQRVGLLLPTSGTFAAAGNAVREGFFTAYFHDGGGAAAHPPVRVYDSGGDPAHALAAYTQAVADGAQLVIGPLHRDAVAAVLGQATLPVPVLALNHPDSNALPPPGATEFALLPEAEGMQVASHMRERGLGNAWLLVSSEDFAQRAAKAFKAQFEALGGHVAGMLTLDPATIDYAGQLSTISASVPAGPDAPGNTGLFISMRPAQARLLMPQVRLARLDMPVFATSHVYAGRDDPTADRDLDGVEFCDAPWLFDAQPGLPLRSVIAPDLEAARGAGARLFAFGMDAWALTPYLDWLRTHPGSYLPGASGELAEDDFGRMQRMLVWARFDDGVARPLAGSLEFGRPTSQPAAGGDALPAPGSSAASVNPG